MGIVHSKLRSRLHPGRVRKTVLISEDIARKWPRPIHESRKRKFGEVETSSTEPAGESDHDPELEEAAATSFATVANDLHHEAQEAAISESSGATPSTGSIPRNNREGLLL